jgi:FMN phosphatase YigB (HAD superfamily)
MTTRKKTILPKQTAEVFKLDSPILIFDLGGTLMEGPNVSPASRFVRELELAEGSKDIINSFLFTENITCPDMLAQKFIEHFPGLTGVQVDKIRKIWTCQFDEGFILAGACEMLEMVRQSGYRAGIISNIWHPYFACFQNLFSDYLDLFDVITLSHVEGIEKPNPVLFRKTIDSLSLRTGMGTPVNPEKICMIGDSYYHDIAPALEMGLKTAWILQKPSREISFLEEIARNEKPPAHLTVSTIRQLAGDSFPLLRALMESEAVEP